MPILSRRAFVLVAVALTAGLAGSVRADGASKVSISPTSDGVEVRVNDRAVATYVAHDAKLKRPFFRSVTTPSGVQVTRNHPPVKGQDAEDHPEMHPGLWLAFGDLGGHDFWRNKGPRVEQESLAVAPDGNGFDVVNRYVDGDRIICRETARYTFHPRPAGYLIDWETIVEPVVDGVYFGEQEEMGLGLRVATPIAVKSGAGGTITNSAGGVNEKGTWGHAAEWCDYSGVIDGRHVGVTLMAGPGNPHKTWFHSRDYGALVANPFGPRAGAPAKLPVAKGQALKLRFGVLVHEGTSAAQASDLAAEYKAFASGNLAAGAGAVVAAAAEPKDAANGATAGKTTPAPAEPEGMKLIFDGKTLDGWDGNPKLWSVKDGVIRGETTAENPTKGNTFIIWKGGTVKDFELRLSFRGSDTNNSGIQYRSQHLGADHKDNPWVVKGYQAEVRVDKETPGFIYDEKGKRGRMCLVGEKAEWVDGKKVVTGSVGEKDAIRAALKPDGWNEYVIIAKGDNVRHYINGVQTIDFTDKDPNLALKEGILALQLHAGKPMWVEFKDIRLKQD